LPYTPNRSTQARRSTYSIKAQQNEKRNTPRVPPKKKAQQREEVRVKVHKYKQHEQ
jgi:hypothetical protein